jgi:hypothetical protein
VPVEEMQPDEAGDLLLYDVDPPGSDEVVARLLTMSGRWPLLLGLINGALVRLVEQGNSTDDSLAEVETRLRADGPFSFDADRPENRRDAVDTTLAASLHFLRPDHRERYLERCAVSPDGRWLATADDDGTVYAKFELGPGHHRFCRADPGGRWLAMAGADTGPHVLFPHAPAERRRVTLPAALTALEVQDGRLVAGDASTWPPSATVARCGSGIRGQGRRSPGCGSTALWRTSPGSARKARSSRPGTGASSCCDWCSNGRRRRRSGPGGR